MMNKTLMPYFAGLITSSRLKQLKHKWFDIRKTLSPSLNTVTFYHRLNDPYSYLLLQCLPELLTQHKLSLEIEFILDLPTELNPEQEKLNKYALQDATRLAGRYNLKFPKNAESPTLQDTFQATSCLLKQRDVWASLKDHSHFLQLVMETTSALWLDSTTTFESCSKRYGCLLDDETELLLEQSTDKLLKNGHYMSAMLHYGGEWYWGVDRLNHLQNRLDKKAYAQHKSLASSNPKIERKNSQPIDFYFSFRSPYSYLAAVRLFKLAQQYPLKINIKPVMPMVMRGLKVPKAKRMYIVHDTRREADLYNIPFGKICDPLGGGIERCMALFFYAKSEKKEQAFILSVTKGIFSEGADVCSDKVMDKLLTRAGLDWNKAKPCLENKDWIQLVESNRNDLNDLGLWGVPSFKYKQLVLWGQDRMWDLEQALKKS